PACRLLRIEYPFSNEFQEPIAGVTLAPRLMTTTIELNVFQLRNESAQQIAGRRPRVRVHVTVNHQDPRRHRVEGSGLDPLALKTQHVAPGFDMPNLIGAEAIPSVAVLLDHVVRLRFH